MARDIQLLKYAYNKILDRKKEILTILNKDNQLNIDDLTIKITPTPDCYIKIKARSLPQTVAHFGLEMFPGCCGATISYNAWIDESFLHKGLGKLLLQIREEASKSCNYTSMWATTIRTNKEAVHLLEKAGYTPLTRFVSSRTDNEITTWFKNLRA